jgi:hypothetical protein
MDICNSLSLQGHFVLEEFILHNNL